MRTLTFIFALLLTQAAATSENEVAEAMAKAATTIFDTDFVWDDPSSTFTPRELEILKKHKVALSKMIAQALSAQESVVGADLAAYFGLEEHTALLRYRLIQPGTTYGWEGPDYSKEENYLLDSQYVYHSRYLAALEALHGARLREVLALTEEEVARIGKLSRSTDSEHYYWAVWLRRRVGF